MIDELYSTSPGTKIEMGVSLFEIELLFKKKVEHLARGDVGGYQWISPHMIGYEIGPIQLDFLRN